MNPVLPFMMARPIPTRFACGLLLGLTLPSSAQAQAALKGTVRDSASQEPVAGVEVLVEALNRTVSTDPNGEYVLVLPLGLHTVLYRNIGHAAARRRIQVFEPDTVRLDVTLAPAVQQLEEIVTKAPETSFLPPGVAERMEAGYGRYVGEELLRKSDHKQLADVLRGHVPGIRMMTVRRKQVAMGRSASATCPMAIWLDGMKIYSPTALETSPFLGGLIQEPYDVNELPVNQMQLIEVYTAATTPAQYQATGSACGTILMWTRRR